MNIIYGTVIFIVIIILAFYANRAFSNAIAVRTISYSLQNLDLIEKELDGFIGYMEDACKDVVINEYVQNFLNEGRHYDESKLYIDKLNITSILDNIIEPREIISIIVVYGFNNYTVASGGINTLLLDEGQNKKKEIFKNDVYYYLDTHAVNYEKSSKESNCITIFHSINDTKVGRTIGYVEINVDETKISQIYSSLKYGYTG